MARTALDVATTLQLIISRDNRAMLLFFAQIVGDYQKVVGLLLTDRKYGDALRVLTSAPLEKVN